MWRFAAACSLLLSFVNCPASAIFPARSGKPLKIPCFAVLKEELKSFFKWVHAFVLVYLVQGNQLYLHAYYILSIVVFTKVWKSMYNILDSKHHFIGWWKWSAVPDRRRNKRTMLNDIAKCVHKGFIVQSVQLL